MPHTSVALITLLSVLVYFWMAAIVARTRRRVGIFAPAMTGNPMLERTIRAHVNTLEWFPIFLPSLWLFAIYWSSPVAAVLGAVWIVGRIIYFLGYSAAAEKRRVGFAIQATAATALAIGALGRVIYLLVTTGAF